MLIFLQNFIVINISSNDDLYFLYYKKLLEINLKAN